MRNQLFVLALATICLVSYSSVASATESAQAEAAKPSFETQKSIEGTEAEGQQTISEEDILDEKAADERVQTCESINVVVYVGYGDHHIVGYQGATPTLGKPTKAWFRVAESLKGPPFGATLPVKYDLREFVPVAKQKNFVFDEKTVMPKKGSKWIVFFPVAVPNYGRFETFRGRRGLIECTEKNYKDVVDRLKKFKLGQYGY